MTQRALWKAMGMVLMSMVLLLLSGSVVGPGAHAQVFTVDVEIEGATIDKLGVITVTGTTTCSEPNTNTGAVSVEVRQPRGGLNSVEGAESAQFALLECDPNGTSWAVQVVPLEGRFKPGITYTEADIFLCGSISTGCDSDHDFLALKVRRLREQP